MSFYKELRTRTDKLWQAIFSHPFVTGIGDGTLPRDRYEFFLKQDYLYLIDFSRLLALGSAKARQLRDMQFFAVALNITLNTEMGLHRKTCHEFGINAAELERTEKSMITSAYTNLLIRTSLEGNFSDIVAVLLPCANGYREIGHRLLSRGLPQNKFYREWIETYTAKEYDEVCDWLENRIDEIAADVDEREKNRWFHLYFESARYEYLFFDMSWKKEL